MNSIKNLIKEWLPIIIIAFAISFAFKTFIAEPTVVPTGSMIPTIQINDRILVEKLTKIDNFERGDIVVFYPPIDSDGTPYVKRLIGIGGDKIEIKNGSLIRNGEKVSEPYIKEPMNYSFGPITVPDGKYFFLGDNRNFSFDAHLWKNHFVDKKAIIGKAFFRFYPLTDIGKLK